jgi:hypothetical protein
VGTLGTAGTGQNPYAFLPFSLNKKPGQGDEVMWLNVPEPGNDDGKGRCAQLVKGQKDCSRKKTKVN